MESKVLSEYDINQVHCLHLLQVQVNTVSEVNGQWLQVVLRGQLEGAPVDSHGLDAPDVLVDPHRLPGVHVVSS